MLALMVAFLCLAALGLLVAVAALEARSLRVTRLRVRIPNWPANAGSLRIAHLSDLHLPGVPVPMDRLLAAVGDIAPHLTVISGDMLSSNADIDRAVSLIRRLAAYGPVLCTCGNSEHLRGFDVHAFADALAPLGARLLRDELWTGALEGVTLCVLGLEYRQVGRREMEDMLARAPETDLTVLIAHGPEVWPEVPRERTHLLLCGHTHGGQLRLPVIGRLLAHSRAEWELKSGIFELPEGGDNWRALRRVFTHEELSAGGGPRDCGFTPGRPLMCVTRGVGCVLLPLRLGSPPEVIGITLSGPAAGDAPENTEVRE